MQGLLDELENRSEDLIKPEDYEVFIRATAKLIDLMKYKYVSAQEKVKNSHFLSKMAITRAICRKFRRFV